LRQRRKAAEVLRVVSTNHTRERDAASARIKGLEVELAEVGRAREQRGGAPALRAANDPRSRCQVKRVYASIVAQKGDIPAARRAYSEARAPVIPTTQPQSMN